MKKFMLLMALAILTALPSFADRVSRNVNDLPAAAQTTLNKYFKGKDVSHIKIDDKFMSHKEYDVILENGTEVEFDHEGNWKEIDCGHKAVPDELILKPIREYVKKNFNNRKIVKIETKRNKYSIELADGVDLEFDRAGNFLRIDD